MQSQVQVLLSAACYFLFNWQFFRCAESFLTTVPLHKRNLVVTFLINYGVFFFCSVWKVHLITNWIIFLFLLFGEQWFLYRQAVHKCFLFALLGTQLGLAVNILFRSLFAVLLDIPLVAFDNRVSDPHNMKVYPVLLGFLVVGTVFLLVAHFHLLEKVRPALADRSTLLFLLGLLIAMYFYLCMNLTVYSVEENNLILKLWSMKSAVFVLVGEWLSLVLAVRIGQLSAYRAKNRESQEFLARERARELELRTIASTDPLTGCENRFQVESRLKAALDSGRTFSLCFVDLNGLKAVNDGFGHELGDQYLLAVTEELKQVCGQDDSLFRYGGDEFLLLLPGVKPLETTERLQRAQERLETTRRRRNMPFYMSVSYGIATESDGTAPMELIETADSRMYQMKLAKRPPKDSE